MGTLTHISNTQAKWSQEKPSDPASGTYTYRGVTKEGSKIYQSDTDENTICICIFNQLVQVSDVKLKNIQSVSGSRSGGANFGLTQSVNSVFSYNATSQQVTTVKFGGSSSSQEVGTPSSSSTFGIPSFICDSNGKQYYPLNYWFNAGNTNYFNPSPPSVNEIIMGRGDTYSKYQIIEALTFRDVRTFGNQSRTPDQSVVMGQALFCGNISARDHLFKCLAISSEPRSWHWCHLIAHSLRHNNYGQVPENLVAGTAGVNGAMLALEKAVKLFLEKYENKIKDIFYEVEAHVIQNTHIAKHIRVRLGQEGWVFTHYMEATVPERELTAQTNEFVKSMESAYDRRNR